MQSNYTDNTPWPSDWNSSNLWCLIAIAAGALLLLLLVLLWRDRRHFRKNPLPGLSCQKAKQTPPL